MSTHWHLLCLDCQEETGHLNHGADQLLDIWRKKARAIAELVRCGGVDEMIICYGSELDPRFFAEHLDHQVVIRSEYGNMLRDCGQQFKCPTCDTLHDCRRKEGHEGEHSKVRDYDPSEELIPAT